MKCPNCGLEMFETIERVSIDHPFAKAERTLRDKTRVKRVYNCGNCKSKFITALVFKEVKNRAL